MTSGRTFPYLVHFRIGLVSLKSAVSQGRLSQKGNFFGVVSSAAILPPLSTLIFSGFELLCNARLYEVSLCALS